MLTNKEIRKKSFQLYKEKCFSLFAALMGARLGCLLLGTAITYFLLKSGRIISQSAAGSTMQAVVFFIATPIYAGISYKMFLLWRGTDESMARAAFSYFASFWLLLRLFLRGILVALLTIPVIFFMAAPEIAVKAAGVEIPFAAAFVLSALFFAVGFLAIFILTGVYMMTAYLLMLKPEMKLFESLRVSLCAAQKYWRRWLPFTLRTLVVPVITVIASTFAIAIAVAYMLRGQMMYNSEIIRSVTLFIVEFFVLTFYVLPYLMTAGAGFVSEMLEDMDARESSVPAEEDDAQ